MPCLFFPLDLVLQPAKEPPSPHLLRQSEGRRRPHQNPLSRDSHARGACPPPRCSQLGPWVLVGPVQRALKPILETPRLGFAVRPAPRPAELRLGSVYGTSSWSLEEWGGNGMATWKTATLDHPPCPLLTFYLECTRAPMETGLPISRSIGRPSFRRPRKWGQVFTCGEESSGRGRRNLCTRSCTSC